MKRILGFGALLVASVAIAIVGVFSLSNGDDPPVSQVLEPSPTMMSGLPPEKQVIEDMMQARRDAAIAQAILHPESVPPKAGIHFLPTPSPTPVPVPFGVPCTSEGLVALAGGENGAGGHTLLYFAILNMTEIGCDLPLITGLDGLNETGATVFMSQIAAGAGCNTASPFCVAEVPLPLATQPTIPAPRESTPGSAGAIIAWYSPCELDDCVYETLTAVRFNFENAVSVIASLARPMAVRIDHGGPSVWSLKLVAD